jgi:RNA polymerase sigma factor (sigma-70 family)
MMDPELTEYELALRARAGDEEALEALVEQTRLRLFAMAFAELRHYDDAQDAVASALLQICLHVHELRHPERIRAWMQQVVRNEIRRLRRARPVTVLPLEDADAMPGSDEPPLLRLEIERALWRLPGDQAQAMRLFYLEGLALEEIARRVGRSIGTIGSWLHRGRQRLAAELEEYAPMKRREALRLLASTPVLAAALEEQTAMATTPTETVPQAAPSRIAAIVHTDLDPALGHVLEEAFEGEGYTVQVIRPVRLTEVAASLNPFQAVVLDETVAGRPALELLLSIRANPDTKAIPVAVLYSGEPPDIAWRAYFIAGTDKLASKELEYDLRALPASLQGLARRIPSWLRYSNRAREVIAQAEEEAAGRGESTLCPEHLLLGLLAVSQAKGSVGGDLLEQRLQIPLESVRDALVARLPRGGASGEMHLSPASERVINGHTFRAARILDDRFIGTEHQLLGLLGESDSLAAQILIQRGADPERIRQAIREMRAEKTAGGA